jgi:hypothetical protein
MAVFADGAMTSNMAQGIIPESGACQIALNRMSFNVVLSIVFPDFPLYSVCVTLKGSYGAAASRVKRVVTHAPPVEVARLYR